MKKIFTLFMPVVVAATIANAQTGSTYNGNGGRGFGGGIGNSILTISDNSTMINFKIQTSGFNGNILVLYLDTKSGGFTNTSSFTDGSDDGRKAISGTADGGTTRTTATFSTGTSGFAADYAITVDPMTGSNFVGVYIPQAGAAHTFLTAATLSGGNTSGATTLTFSINKTTIGLFSGVTFDFVGTLISRTAYRSNETYGVSTTSPDPLNPATDPNAGTTGTTTFDTRANNGIKTYGFTILPLKLVSFSGKNDNGSVVLNWVTNNENGVQGFVVEGSTTTAEWRSLATVAAKNTAKAEYSQTLTDAANTFYRLKMVDKDGKTTYSAIINLKSGDHSIKLITNPVIGAVRLSLNEDAAKYTTTLYSMDGKVVATAVYNHPGGVSTFEMPVGNIAKGNYLLRIAGASMVKSFNVVVQ